MRNVYYLLLVILTAILGCSEGDIISDEVQNFNSELKNCSNETNNTFVFYKTNGANKSFSLNFTSAAFDLAVVPETLSQTIALNGSSNTLLYREFNTTIEGESYYCTSVSPNGISVLTEYVSTNGGAEFKYIIKSETDTTTTYSRNLVLTNITFVGPDISIRKESFDFGSDELIVSK